MLLFIVALFYEKIFFHDSVSMEMKINYWTRHYQSCIQVCLLVILAGLHLPLSMKRVPKQVDGIRQLY